MELFYIKLIALLTFLILNFKFNNGSLYNKNTYSYYKEKNLNDEDINSLYKYSENIIQFDKEYSLQDIIDFKTIQFYDSLFKSNNLKRKVSFHHSCINPILLTNKLSQSESINNQTLILDLSFNHIDSLNLRVINILIKKLKILETLILDGNEIQIDDLKILIQTLRKNTYCNIKNLSLSSCNLNDNMMESLSFLFKSNPNILSLDISNNKITAEGLGELLANIHSSNSLNMLDLSYNSIGNTCMIYYI